MANLQTLLNAMPRLSPEECQLITSAYHRAETAHAGQFRKSGEPYFSHCVAVAMILAEDMRLDAETISAGLMHDLIEDTKVTYEVIADEFGTVIANLVSGVSKLEQIPPLNLEQPGERRTRDLDRELEYFRRMLLMMADDVRVVLIKLADRLHNMRTLNYMAPEKQLIKAQETMEIFAPLANRLGIWQIKWELEDLAFRYLEPDAYRMIAASLDERRTDREAYLKHVQTQLTALLEENEIYGAVITGRPKHLYSIYKKMVRKGVPFNQIYDLRAVRIIVDSIPQCYLVLGMIHSLWKPIRGEFDDYIATPKDNFYQSLHTAVMDENGNTLEVQVRTREMHEHAEFGVAAHWRYKEGGGGSGDERFNRRILYLRRLMDFSTDADDAGTFMERMKNEVLEERVFVFTPKADIVDLPAGATPIDFAYQIHTEIGHRVRGALVNGKMVTLDYVLRSGDRVEILTNKVASPSLDWLSADQGYVKTDRARAKIRHWLRQQDRDKHIASGRDLLERELKKLGLSDQLTFEAVAALFERNLDDFFAAVGVGDITTTQINNRLLENVRRAELQRETEDWVLKSQSRKAPSRQGFDTIQVDGSTGFAVYMARCCSPILGDDIIGYVTRGRGVTVHRSDCANILANKEPERLIGVSWVPGGDRQGIAVDIEVVAHDREGLLGEIGATLASEHVNITNANVNTRSGIAKLHFTMELAQIQTLPRILTRLQNIRSVVEAYRKHMN